MEEKKSLNQDLHVVKRQNYNKLYLEKCQSKYAKGLNTLWASNGTFRSYNSRTVNKRLRLIDAHRRKTHSSVRRAHLLPEHKRFQCISRQL